jgi:hypothetical protein
VDIVKMATFLAAGREINRLGYFFSFIEIDLAF